MTTELYYKKLFACKRLLMDRKFKYPFVADASDNVNYVRIRVLVPKLVTRVFLQKMSRHYINFFSAEPCFAFATNLVTFYVALSSHRKEYIETINEIAKSRDKMLVL